jgi:tryptophan halogenase
MKNTTCKATILGGGTAGWLTALFIKRTWPSIEISVIEDPSKPPIIAGESGTTTFVDLLKYIKIDIDDFIKSVNATPKLGGRFTDWDGIGTEFVHALQTDYAPWLDGWTEFYEANSFEEISYTKLNTIMSSERDKEIYLRTIIGNKIPLSDAFLAKYFIDENKVPLLTECELPVRPMWHFESRSSAAYFKKLGLEKGVKLIEGTYVDSKLDEQGNIDSILLEDGRFVQGDWFFDCSGFARLLLNKKLGEPIIDYSDYFPARAVIAWWDKPCYCNTTNAIAMKYGWSWNINLRHRSGNGYIYDPDHITEDQALAEAEERFGIKIEPIAKLKFQPGMARNTWKNNVVAIGLSNGFIEPLEANGVAVIIESLYALHDHWKPFQQEQVGRERFNLRTWVVSEDIKDFLALHYRGHRRDTEFWQSHGNDKFRIPNSLQEKLDLWAGYFYELKEQPYFNGYSPTAWLMVLQGLEIFDNKTIEENFKNFLNRGAKTLNINKARYKQLVAPHYTIDEWIKRTAG